MNKLLRFGSTYTAPAVAYQPARPAYTTYQSYQVVVPQPSSGNGLAPGWVYQRIAYPQPDGTVNYQWEPRYLGQGVGTSQPVAGPGGTYTVTYTVAVYHPAVAEVPGSPSVRIDNPPVGWTSFAHSAASIRGGIALWKVSRDAAGVAIGLTGAANPQAGYAHIRQGLLFSGTTVRNLRTGAAYGSFETADEFGMAVGAETVRFTKNGSEIATEAKGYTPAEQLFLSAAMYASGDTIDAPSLLEAADGTSTARAPAAQTFSGNIEGGTSIARAPAQTAESRSDLVSLAVSPIARTFSGNLEGGSSLARAPASRVTSYGGDLEIIVPSNSVAQAPAQTAASLGVVHVVGTGSAVAPATRVMSFQAAGGQSFARSPAARALSYNEEPGTAFIVAGLQLDIDITATRVDRIDVLEALALDIDITVERVERIEIREALALDIQIAARTVDRVTIPMSLALDIEITVPGSDLEVWAVSVDGFGSASYANFPFNSFARIGELYYGAKEDGLFRLGGDTDAGAEIRAAISPGNLDFGTPQKKTIVEAWLGAASESALACSLTALQEVFVYKADSFSPDDLERHRIKFGKGLKASYIRPVFFNTDGGDFEVDAIEFEIATLSRKK